MTPSPGRAGGEKPARRRRVFGALALMFLAGGVVAAVNSGRGPPVLEARPLLAHRGVSQTFSLEGVGDDTCTARRIDPPRHPFIENTLPSMQASFDAGASILEIDVHPTTDGEFAVFHDWRLECRTDGAGETRARSMAELRTLDVGYGYTADGGRTYPFRGLGVGLMPSLDEVLDAFPDRRFLINIKSNDPLEGRQLARALAPRLSANPDRLLVYGGDRPIAEFRRLQPRVRTLSRADLKTCLSRYMLIGWTGRTPAACERRLILVPLNVGPWLWGWPALFTERMKRAGSEVFVVGAWRGGAFTSGIDDVRTLGRVPDDYPGGLMTNEIRTIAAYERSLAAIRREKTHGGH